MLKKNITKQKQEQKRKLKQKQKQKQSKGWMIDKTVSNKNGGFTTESRRFVFSFPNISNSFKAYQSANLSGIIQSLKKWL